MILARILIAIIIGGLALIGYLLYLLAAINRRDPKWIIWETSKGLNGSKLGVCESALSRQPRSVFGLAAKAG